MYENALILHSILRWVVLLTGLYAFWRAFSGWTSGRAKTGGDRSSQRWFTIAVDVQFTLGLLMWLVWSPTVQQARKDFGAAMKDSEMRYWAVEHGTLMLVAVALVHVGKVLAKKARDDKSSHFRAALFFGLSLALMIAMAPWPGTAHARPWLRIGG